jgi:hypothetical protein
VLASGTLAEVRADPEPEVQAFFRRESMTSDDDDGLLDRLEVRHGRPRCRIRRRRHTSA